TLQPSLAIALQYRDGFEIRMRVSGCFVTGRRILNADADGRRALCVADKRLIGRSAFERLRFDVAMAHNWHCCSPIIVLVHAKSGSVGQFLSDPIPQLRDLLHKGRKLKEVANTSLANGAGQGNDRKANPFSHHSQCANSQLVIEDAQAGKRLHNFPPVEQTPARLAPPKGASPGAPFATAEAIA